VVSASLQMHSDGLLKRGGDIVDAEMGLWDVVDKMDRGKLEDCEQS
jgi:hypothetical protein